MGGQNYQHGDGVGLGLLDGNLVYKVLDGKHYLSTRTTLHPIPPQIVGGGRGPIRNWALEQYRLGKIQPPFYPGSEIARNARELAGLFVKSPSNQKAVNYLHGDGVGVPGGNLLYKVDPKTGRQSLCSKKYCWVIPSNLDTRNEIRAFGAKLVSSVPIPSPDLYPGSFINQAINGVKRIDFLNANSSKKEVSVKKTLPQAPQKTNFNHPYQPGNGIDVGPGVVVFDIKARISYIRTRHQWYKIPRKVDLTKKEAVQKWAKDAFLSGAFGDGGALYDPISGKTEKQRHARALERNANFTNTKLVPINPQHGIVNYKRDQSLYLESKLLERQQYMGPQKGWEKTAYVMKDVRIFQNQPFIKNQKPGLDGLYAEKYASEEILLKNSQGIPYDNLEDARNAALRILQWRGFSKRRDEGPKNSIAGLLGAFNNNLISGVSQTGVKLYMWASTGGTAPKESYNAIDRFYEQGKKDIAKILGTDPDSQAYQRSELVGTLIIWIVSAFNLAKSLFHVVKAGPSIVVGLKNIRTLGVMLRNPGAMKRLVELIIEKPHIYKILSPELKSLAQMALLQSTNPRAVRALSMLWKGRKVGVPILFSMGKGLAYAANYLADPQNIKSTWQETAAGLFSSPGFHIAIITGAVMGGVLQWGAVTRLKAGASMAEVLKIIGHDAFYWSMLSVISSVIGRGYNGEEILTYEGFLKTVAAALNGGFDGSFTGLMPGSIFPFNSRIYEMTQQGLVAFSFKGIKDLNMWKQGFFRFTLAASLDGVNQWASKNGDFEKINVANMMASGVQSLLYPFFMASIQKLTMANYSSLSKIWPSLFSQQVVKGTLQVTSSISDTVLSNLSYGSRYMVYGISFCLLKKDFEKKNLTFENFEKNMTQDLLNGLYKKVQDILKDALKFKEIVQSPEFKQSMQHIDALPPVMQWVAVGAYNPSPGAVKAIKNLSSSNNGLKKLAQIPIQPHLSDSQTKGILDGILIQANTSPIITEKSLGTKNITSNFSENIALNMATQKPIFSGNTIH